MPFQQNTHYYINDLVQSSMLQIDRDIQRPEKYKQNFGVSTEGPTNLPKKGLRSKRRRSPCILQVVVSLSLGSYLIL
jgi:ribosomal protein S10